MYNVLVLQGYWRCAQILKPKKNYNEALGYLSSGLLRCADMTAEIKAQFAAEIFRIVLLLLTGTMAQNKSVKHSFLRDWNFDSGSAILSKTQMFPDEWVG